MGTDASMSTRCTTRRLPFAVVRRLTGHGRSTQIARDARRENVHSPCYDDGGQHVWRMVLPRTRCSASTSNRTLLILLESVAAVAHVGEQTARNCRLSGGSC